MPPEGQIIRDVGDVLEEKYGEEDGLQLLINLQDLLEQAVQDNAPDLLNNFLDDENNSQITDFLTEEREDLGGLSILATLRKQISTFT